MARIAPKKPIKHPEIKAYVNTWLFREKYGTPVYDHEEQKLMRANGTLTNHPLNFICKMSCTNVPFQGVGIAKSKKAAETEAARNMCRFLIKTGRMLPEEVSYVTNSHEVLQNLEIQVSDPSKPPEPEVVTLSSLKNKYAKSWKPGGVVQEQGGRVLPMEPDIKLVNDDANGASTSSANNAQLNKCLDLVEKQKLEIEKKLAAMSQPARSGSKRGFGSPAIDLSQEDQHVASKRLKTEADSIPSSRQRQPSVVELDDDYGSSSGVPYGALRKAQSTPQLSDRPAGNPMINVMVRESDLAHADRYEQAKQFGARCSAQFEQAMRIITEQTLEHYNTNRQDDDMFQWKMTQRRQLLNELRRHPQLKDAQLYAVGSTINGCGSFNSDMDLCMALRDWRHTFNTDRNWAVDHLKMAANYLRRNVSGFVSTVEFIPAKVPILRLNLVADNKELEVDLNVNNVAGIYNSHLCHYYARCDDRFPALALMIKHWAIRADICDAMSGTFNSYSLILLVVHYLQVGCSPPILPNLQQLFPQLFSGLQPVEEIRLQQEFPAPIPGKGANQESLASLLAGFFAYYGEAFDYEADGISIRHACRMPRFTLPPNTGRYFVYIEEPFDLINTARCLTRHEQFQRCKQAFASAARVFRNNPSLAAIGVVL